MEDQAQTFRAPLVDSAEASVKSAWLKLAAIILVLVVLGCGWAHFIHSIKYTIK